MKLVVTIGTTDGSVEQEFDIPEGKFATYLGLELIAANDPNDEVPGTGRMTILRTPFYFHKTQRTIHTICSRYDDEIRVYGDEYEPAATNFVNRVHAHQDAINRGESPE